MLLLCGPCLDVSLRSGSGRVEGAPGEETME